MRRTRSGYARRDLIVAAVIVLVGAGLLIAAVGRVRERDSARAQTVHNLRTIALACHKWNDQFRKLPPIHNGTHGVQVYLAPFFDYDTQTLVSPADYSCRGVHQDFIPLVTSIPYHSPQSPALKKVPHCGLSANYYVFGNNNSTRTGFNHLGADGVTRPNPELGPHFGYTPLSVQSVPDGAAHTLLFVTCLARWGQQGRTLISGNTHGADSTPGQSAFPMTTALDWASAPHAETYEPRFWSHAESFSSDGIQVALVDGSTRTLSQHGVATPQRSGVPRNNCYAAAMLPADGTHLTDE